MSFRPLKDSRGHIIGVEFHATAKMLRVVVEMNKDENKNLSNEDILKKCKVSETEYRDWWNNFVIHEYGKDGEITSSKNHFEEWFDDALQIKSGEERALLRQVGMQKALEGEYNFWFQMAKTYGAVNPEAVHERPTTIPFNLKDDLTPEQIADARQKLLAANRAVGHAGGAGLSRLTAKRQKSADS